MCGQFCSDAEDLFGDYDSLLGDSSFLAKLDDAEQHEQRRNAQTAELSKGADQRDFVSVRSSENSVCKKPSEDVLTDSILDILADEPFERFPASQQEFQEQVEDVAKRSKLQDGDRTSTPSRHGHEEGRREREKTKARKSVSDQLRRTMLGNATSPANVCRSAALKEAVVSEEISVAVQAMEAVSSQTTDLGPFFGLPSRVKELIFKLRGIKSLYGESHGSCNRSGRCFLMVRLLLLSFASTSLSLSLSPSLVEAEGLHMDLLLV